MIANEWDCGLKLETVKKMRTLCDVCEKAAALFFCAADEAALCSSCDDKVHMCNKLASRHVRVRIADPKAVPRCDICESSPAFFYCEIDGSSLCLQCDMIVHVGGKRTHRRYLMLRQRVEFPTDRPGQFEDPASRSRDQVQTTRGENTDLQNHRDPSGPVVDTRPSINEPAEGKMFDLNIKPYRLPENHSNNQQ